MPSTLTADALVSWDMIQIYLGTANDPLDYEDQAYTEGLINAVSARANMMTGRKLRSRAATVTLDGNGRDIILLPEFPVDSVAEVRIDTKREFGDETIIPSASYDVYEDGRLYVEPRVPFARRCVRVTYTAGFEPVPDDLQQAVVESVAYSWKRLRSRAIGTQSITAEGVTTQFEIDIPIPAKRVFESYRRFE